MASTPPPIAICLGTEDDHTSAAQVAAACSVSGAWLVATSVLGTIFTIITLICARMRSGLTSDRRVEMYDIQARNCYISGILHLCVCLCYWMVLSRTPFYFLVPPFFLGVLFIIYGLKFTKWSDNLHDQDRASQLLVNLLQRADQNLEASNINAPPGLFRIAPDEGYEQYDVSEQDLEAPSIGSEDLKIATGEQVSDIESDDLESFDSSGDEDDNIPETDDCVLVDDDEGYENENENNENENKTVDEDEDEELPLGSRFFDSL